MEKDKRDKGLLYYGNDSILVKERIKCKKLCNKYNKTNNIKIINKLLKCIGSNFEITPPFYCDYGYNIKIGDNFYSNHNLVILDCAKVTFGNNVFIGPNCGFYTAGHPVDFIERNKGLEYAKEIKVGDNVWFGGNVCVLPGVTIGSNVVIGAGSVVVHDIESNTVAAGNPCKVLKNIK